MWSVSHLTIIVIVSIVANGQGRVTNCRAISFIKMVLSLLPMRSMKRVLTVYNIFKVRLNQIKFMEFQMT